MINRALLRTKIVQTLYSCYKNEGRTPSAIEKELFHSIEKTYDLYFYLLLLAIEITHYAAEKIDTRKHKLRPTDEDLNPNTRFADNRFMSQLSNNKQFTQYIKEQKLTWSDDMDIVRTLYEEILSYDFYQTYMNLESVDYDEDKNIWKKIFKKVILQSEELDETIEDLNLYWTDDIEIVVSFIIKTIKRFDEQNGSEQLLLPMFKDEEDREFARKLMQCVLSRAKEFREWIKTHSKNWDLDRIAFMDIVIMEVALAELVTFPTIPVNVTLNEYIEIAKNYSTDRSAIFINGILDNIVKSLKKENKLIKVVVFNENKK